MTPPSVTGETTAWSAGTTFMSFEVTGWMPCRGVPEIKGAIFQKVNSGDCVVGLCWRRANDINDPNSQTTWTVVPGTATLTQASSPDYGSWQAATDLDSYRYFQLGVWAKNGSGTATEICIVGYTFDFR